MKDIKIKDLKNTNIGSKVVIKGAIKVSNNTAKNGSKYISISINDGTGEIWDNIFKDKKETLYNEIDSLEKNGKYRIVGNIRSVKEGTAGFNGINIEKIELIENSIPKTKDVNEIKNSFKEIFKTIQNEELKKIITNVYKEIDMNLFYTIPVSENHYVYQGGLAEHIIRTNQIINAIVDSYNGTLDFDKDLLTTAVLLFRVGKTKTINWINGKAQLTEEGVLFEDSSITHDIVAKHLDKSNINSEIKMRLLHMIDASKYLPEYGALAEPKTKEAFLLYYAEMLSLNEAKFAHLKESVLDEENPVIYAPNRKVYYMTEKKIEDCPKEKEDK
jgi:23S rRNA maturation-related 3'-5' exoribonuclease YhaM